MRENVANAKGITSTVWNEAVKIELPAKQLNPWVDGLEMLITASLRTSKAFERIAATESAALLAAEQQKVARLEKRVSVLESEQRKGAAQELSVASTAGERDARLRQWTQSIAGAVGRVGEQLSVAREAAWTPADKVEEEHWSAAKLGAAVDELRQLGGHHAPATAAAADRAAQEVEQLDLERWMDKIGGSLRMLLDAGVKGVADLVTQWYRMRERDAAHELQALELKAQDANQKVKNATKQKIEALKLEIEGLRRRSSSKVAFTE